MDQEDSRLAKRDLTHRFRLIQEQKAVTSTDDFECVKWIVLFAQFKCHKLGLVKSSLLNLLLEKVS